MDKIKEKFELRKAEDGNHMIVHHEPPQFILVFENNRFNESQKIRDIENLESYFKNDFMAIPKLMRKVGEWAMKNHPEII